MSNPELQKIWRKEAKPSGEREGIPNEHALAIQMKLPFLMAPQNVNDVIAEGRKDIADALVMRFMDKYAFEHNVLDMFCGDQGTSPEVLARLSDGTFTADDLSTIVAYIKAKGLEPLFKDKAEEQEFLNLKPLRH